MTTTMFDQTFAADPKLATAYTLHNCPREHVTHIHPEPIYFSTGLRHFVWCQSCDFTSEA
jgi:hypothetical protein